ncbi:MAG: hypothetical protein ABI707_04265 [Ferruginibacter sp.]
MLWRNGRLYKLNIVSKAGNECRIKYGIKEQHF